MYKTIPNKKAGTLKQQVKFIRDVRKREFERTNILSQQLNKLKSTPDTDLNLLKPIINHCAELLSIKDSRHKLHVFLQTLKYDKDHCLTERNCAGALHCQWVDIFAPRAKDPNDEHARYLTYYSKIHTKEDLGMSKQDKDFKRAMQKILNEISETFELTESNILSLPFRTISTINKMNIQNSIINTQQPLGLESLLTHSNIETSYQPIVESLGNLSVYILEKIKSQLNSITSTCKNSPSISFYNDQYCLSKHLKETETPHKKNTDFDSCRNNLLICGELAHLSDEIINLFKSFQDIISTIIRKKFEASKQEKSTPPDTKKRPKATPPSKSSNCWISIQGKPSSKPENKSTQEFTSLLPIQPMITPEDCKDEPPSKLNQKQSNKKTSKSKKKEPLKNINNSEDDFETTLLMSQFNNNNHYLSAIETLISIYSEHSNIEKICYLINTTTSSKKSMQETLTPLCLKSFSDLKDSLNEPKKTPTKKKKNSKKKLTKSINQVIKKEIELLLKSFNTDTKDPIASSINSTDLSLVFKGNELYIGPVQKSILYHGNGFLISLTKSNALDINIGTWNMGQCEFSCPLESLPFELYFNDKSTLHATFGCKHDNRWGFLEKSLLKYQNGMEYYGSWEKKNTDEWGFVGKGVINAPDKKIYHGTWEISNDGVLGLCGEGRLEYPNNNNCFGTWGIVNGTPRLCGKGRKEHASGMIESGTWGKIDEKTWGLTEEGAKYYPDKERKDFGTWGMRRPHEWGLTGKGRQEFDLGHIDYGTWGERGPKEWGFVGKGKTKLVDGTIINGNFEKQKNNSWIFVND